METPSAESEIKPILWGAVGALLLLWIVLTLLRAWTGESDDAAMGDRLWEVRLKVDATDVVSGAIASVAIPLNTDHLRLVGQQSSFPGWRQRPPAAGVEKGGRRLHLLATETGQLGFEVSYTIHQSTAPRMQRAPSSARLSVEQLESYLASNPLLGLDHEIVRSEVATLTSGSESLSEMRRRIAIRAHQLLPRPGEEVRPVPEVLVSGRASLTERINVMIALCRATNQPARRVAGVVLQEGSPQVLHQWVEVYDDELGWLAFDPLHGFRRGVPVSYLPFVKGRADLVTVQGGRPEFDLAVTNVDEMLNLWTREVQDWRDMFYLTRLPLDVRESFAVMLLMPLAVLLSMAFREFTGVHSYGVFTPTLFALVLTRAPWQGAATMLGLVLLFGVLGRWALPAELKRTPRLTLVITLVALGTVASVSIMDYLALNPDGQVMLLSIVILATMVDRIYRTLDSEGLDSVINRLGWTLLQTVFLCLPIMQYEALGHLLVERPETHLLTLAAILLVTNRSGRYLADHPRFRWMRWPKRRKAPDTAAGE